MQFEKKNMFGIDHFDNKMFIFEMSQESFNGFWP